MRWDCSARWAWLGPPHLTARYVMATGLARSVYSAHAPPSGAVSLRMFAGVVQPWYDGIVKSHQRCAGEDFPAGVSAPMERGFDLRIGEPAGFRFLIVQSSPTTSKMASAARSTTRSLGRRHRPE